MNVTRRKYELKIILLVFLSVTSLVRMRGQIDIQMRFNHLLSPNYELRSNAITSIAQDKSGFIWMGSRKGVFQYNGNDYKAVAHVNEYLDSTLRSDIYTLHIDDRGWLWIGTQHGLVVYDPNLARIKKLPEYIEKDVNAINGISSTQSGNVIIATQYNLYAYIASESTFLDLSHSIQGVERNRTLHFYSICEMDQHLWVSTSLGLCQLRKDASGYALARFYDFKNLYDKPFVTHRKIDLIKGRDGGLVVGAFDKLLKFNIDECRLESYWVEDEVLEDERIRALAMDKDNRLWIGTMSGIFIDDPNGVISVTQTSKQSNSLSDDRIRALFVDRNNTIWVGTYFGGVNYWSDRNINFFHFGDKTERGLADKIIKCIAEDNNGIVYFGTEKSGVVTYNPKTGEYGNALNNQNQPFSPISCIFPDNNNEVWFGTISDGLVCYNSETGKHKAFLPKSDISPKLVDNQIRAIEKECDTLFWVSIKSKGLHKFNPKTGVFIPIVPVGNRQHLKVINRCKRDGLGNLWCAMPDRLYVLKHDSIKQKRYHFSEVKTGQDNALFVYDIYVDNCNVVWFVGANNLLFKHTPKGICQIHIDDNVSIFSIVPGEKSNLWLSSSIGVIQLNTQTDDFKVYDGRHGLYRNAFCDGAGIRASNGNIYFGGTSGVTYFNPSTSSNDTLGVSKGVIITNLLVYNKPVEAGDLSGILSQSIEYTDELTLQPKQNMFAIKFAYDDFGYSARYNFEYRLIGLSEEWIQSSTPMVAYTLQSGGDYVFEVRCLSSDGEPISQIKRLHINLKNPFWKTGWAYALYVSVILLFFSGVFYLNRSRMKLDFQLQMELANSAHRKQVNEHKLNFFTNLSHDFRTPLTLIVGAVDQFISKYSLNHEMYKTISTVQKNTNQLLRLINDLMNFQKIESKQMRLRVYEDNIVTFVREIFLSFKIQADIKKIKYEFSSSADDIPLCFDPPKMERVIYNLLSNAFKFTEDGGEVRVSLTQHTDTVEISLEDSGCGIVAENQSFIFDPFYEENNKINSENKGTGIGLSISKSIVELHNGTLSFTSTQNVGTTFVINLLKGKAHFEEEDFTDEHRDAFKAKPILLNENEIGYSKIDSIVEDTWRKTDNEYSILIAEDNEELGLYLKESLSEYFNVTLEENGKVAFRSVLNDPPDLIISDVMMPVMDGIEFCKKIKTTMETSHIPFIMLTARTALVYRFEGLESGAEEYMSKPFHFKELLLKCFNILKTQDNLRKQFLNEMESSPKEIKTSPSDKDLYNKAMKILNKNVGNNVFGVEDLCEELGLSRSVLYERIKEWTGQSPGELLMGFRMKHAILLLEQDRYSIAEVANMVGFKRANYFSKSFKNYHKLTPSEYISKYL